MKKIKPYKIKAIFSKPTVYLKKKKRYPGIWTGKVKIEKDFDMLPHEFIKFFKY